MTTPRKATPPRKAAPRRLTSARRAVVARREARDVFASLSSTDQEIIVRSIMDYPDGCEEGKRDYIEQVGLPLTSTSFSLILSSHGIGCRMPGAFVDASGYLNDKGKRVVGEAVSAAVVDALTKVGVTDIEEVELDIE